MDQLTNFLNNLKPGGSSQMPKSKFERNLTDDSDLETSETKEVKEQLQESKTVQKMNKRPKIGTIKQFTDVNHESSEFVELSSGITSVSQLTENDQIPTPVPRKSNSEKNHIEQLWKNLYIGENGYITNQEFEYACLILDLDNINKEELKILFKNTNDHISWSEFSTGLKEYEKLQRKEIQLVKIGNYVSCGLFSTIDPTNKGFCKIETIIELWASEGLLNGINILKHFKMDKNERVNLISLSAALNDSLKSVESDPIILAAIISYKKELNYFRFMLKKFKDKLKTKSKTEINSDQEKEIIMLNKKNNECNVLINRLEQHNAFLQDQCKELNQEISIVELQNVQLKDLNKKLEKSNSCMRKEVENSKNLEKKNLDVFTSTQEKEKELLSAMNKINEFENDNKTKISEINDLKEMNTKLQNENNILLNKIANFSSKIEIAINREKEYQRKLRDKDMELDRIQELENQLCENQINISNQKNDYEYKLNEQSNQIENIIKESEKSLALKELKLNALENQMNQFQQLQLDLDQCQNEIRYKQDIIDKLEEANDRLSISIRNAVSKLELLSRKDSDLKPNQLIVENIQIQKENLLLEDEINTLKKSLVLQPPSQIQPLEKEVKCLQMQINQKNIKIDELEHKMRNDLSTSSSRSLKRYDFLQFQYDELNKKYEIQMEQVEKTDDLLKELYEGNTKLLMSLRQMEIHKESAEMNVRHLEDKVKTLQNVINRETKS